MLLTHGVPLVIQAPSDSKLNLELRLCYPPLPEKRATLTLDIVGTNPHYQFDLDFQVAWIEATLDCKLIDSGLELVLLVRDEELAVQQAVTLHLEGA